MTRKPLCFTIAALLAAPALGLSMPATAQEAAREGAQSEAATLDTITVSARRREESIQTVPVAVSAFSAEDMAELQVRNVDSLQGAVPNLNIVQGRGSSSAVNVFIRGIGQPDALQTFDPGVGMYVDDVYYSRIQGALFGLFDVERVEVLRGPQGTLYGKNSTGGAIKLVTRSPEDEAEGAVELTVGNFGRLEGKFYGATGASDSGVSASLAVSQSQSDGFVRDPDTGRRFNDDDTASARAKVLFRPSDRFSATFTADWTRQDNALTLGRPEAPLIATDLALGPVVLRPADTGEWDYRSRTSFGPDQGQKLLHTGASLAMDYSISDAWLFKSITAQRWLKTKAFIDIDASELQIGDVYVGLDQDQFSQEFQLQYDNGGNLQAVYGLYYLKEDVPSEQVAFANDFIRLGGAPVDFLRTIDDDLSTTSYAAFAHANWEFAPSWTLAAGIRYTRESKDYFRTTTTFWGAPLQALGSTFAFDIDDTWSAVTPSISLQKAFSERVMGYVSANRGFKSGGFNGRANSPIDVSTFDPEYVWTYEAGLKLQSRDQRLQANIAAFRSDYEDFQARVSEIVNPNDPVPNFSFPVLNAAELTIDGIEFEGIAIIGSGTRLSAQIGFMDARYERFDDPRVTLNPALASLHDHVPFSPDVTARLAASQSFYTDAGNFTVGGDWSYRDDVWLSVDNREALKQDAYGLLGLFGLWDSVDGRFQVRAGVRNLTDKVYKTEGQEFSSVGNIQTAYYGMPRNYYVSLRYNF